MKPRIYLYKVSFEEIPHWYWGVHKEKTYGEFYLGSPKTHRWMWDFYTPILEIVEYFSYNEEGWKKAQEIENRCIKPDLNNCLCLNEHCGSITSLYICQEAGKVGGVKGGQVTFLLKKGIHGRSVKQMQTDGKNAANCLHAKKDKNGKSIHGLKAAKRLQAAMSPEEKTKRSRKAVNKVNKQLWQSTIDGFKGRACSVALHNKANGWDLAAKIKIG